MRGRGDQGELCNFSSVLKPRFKRGMTSPAGIGKSRGCWHEKREDGREGGELVSEPDVFGE